MSASDVLSAEQQEQFLSRGFVVIPECFSREFAEEWKARAYERLGYDPNDPATWVQSRHHMKGESSMEVKDLAPKAWEAICALMGGADRVKQPCRWYDNFIVNFRDGADEPWQSPAGRNTGWHVDGDWFQHFLDGPEQGLLVLAIWSDIETKGGGTYIACDSVGPVARFLASHPEGVDPYGFPIAGLIAQCKDRIEVTGKIGDVALVHPFMLHTSSQNILKKPRFITNPAISFSEPMKFYRENSADYSLVELAILRALGVDHLDFQATGSRQLLNSAEVHAAQRQKMAAKQ
jgi:hypothetical protein